MLKSYSSPFNYGHNALESLFDGCVVAQEKIDGSQFSFGVRGGIVFMRSRRQDISFQVPKMFSGAAETVGSLFENRALVDGWTYRGEVLATPKHNTLSYARVPHGHIILFDIDRGDQAYLSPEDLADVSQALGLECVPYFYVDEPPTQKDLEDWLSEESVLGGCTIEGLVFKNYQRFGKDKKVLMGKYVSESFKERHNKDWKNRNPNRKDVVANIIADFGSDARYVKAVQHLQESDQLTYTPQDIGALMKELVLDFEGECVEDIKDILWEHFRKEILRGVTKDFPNWYKQYLSRG